MIADSIPTNPKMFQCRRNADESKDGGRGGDEEDGGQLRGKISMMRSTASNTDNVVSA